MSHPAHRDTIFLEDAVVLRHEAFPGDQWVLRLRAPQAACRAEPGQFAHIACDPALPMRRPISIMRASPDEGWIELLYKVVGDGTRLLSRRIAGETLSVLAPIGRPFEILGRRPLLVGGGVGMPPMVFLADRMRCLDVQPFVILGSEVPFPFTARPSQILVPGLPDGVIGAMPLLDDWGVPSRLASRRGYPGCYDGFVTGLAEHWLASLDDDARREVAVYACGPHAMLEAVVSVARRHGLPCQVSLEEYMACAVGGCAGCTVRLDTPSGPAMKRVCVDGPVFDGYQAFPPAA
jgi:dihydroorotate dehydrogenase electron transfer subunit